MLNSEHTKKLLEAFRRNVVRESRKNLKALNKDVTGSLSKSLTSELNVSKQSFSLQFLMEEYGNYVDRGVSGTERKYNTPFAYTTKMPPSRVFDKWAIKKGLDGVRDKEGKFIKRKSMSFLIARSIFKKGIKPSLFFTKPFEKYFAKLPNELINEFGLDVEDFIDYTLKNTFE